MTDKLHGITEGDTVEVTFRGGAGRRMDGGVSLSRDGFPAYIDWWGPNAIASPHFTIRKVEEPLKVGDRVWVISEIVTPRDIGTIKAIVDDEAWVSFGGISQVRRLSKLKRSPDLTVSPIGLR